MNMSQPNFCTTDVATCQDYISKDTGTHRFEPSSKGRLSTFSHWAAMLGSLSLNRVEMNCTHGFSVVKAKRASYYSFQFVQKGQCCIEGSEGQFFAGPGDVFVLNPDRFSEEHWSSDCEQFVVRIEQDAVNEVVSDLFGRKPTSLQFKPVSQDPGIASWLTQTYKSFGLDGNPVGGLFANAHVADHLGQSLVMMLLSGLEHSGSVDLIQSEARFAPYYVKRVEKFFLENFADDISMADVIAVADVSVRTVFYGFQRWRGTTPMTYLRELRLAMARCELQNSRPGPGAVSAAAIATGFTNFGQFSKLYRARFGEKPSATVARATH